MLFVIYGDKQKDIGSLLSQFSLIKALGNQGLPSYPHPPAFLKKKKDYSVKTEFQRSLENSFGQFSETISSTPCTGPATRWRRQEIPEIREFHGQLVAKQDKNQGVQT